MSFGVAAGGLRVALAVVCTAAGLLVSGCTAAPPLEEGAPIVIRRDITYGSAAGSALMMDACLPDGVQDAPRVVVVHGGSFTSGSRSDPDVSTLCRVLAENGYAAFSLDYRLAPGAVFPAQVDDVVTALNFLGARQQRATFAAGTPVALLGVSAGAVIAQEIATGIRGGVALQDPLDAVVSLSGGSDFDHLGVPEELRHDVASYLGCDANAFRTCALRSAASPIQHVSSATVPLLLLNSAHELVPTGQATRMYAAVRDAGGGAELYIAPGSVHAAGILDSDSGARQAVRSFLAAHLGGAAS